VAAGAPQRSGADPVPVSRAGGHQPEQIRGTEQPTAGRRVKGCSTGSEKTPTIMDQQPPYQASSSQHHLHQQAPHRVAPYPTPQQYMLNKRAKYAGTTIQAAAASATNIEVSVTIPACTRHVCKSFSRPRPRISHSVGSFRQR